MRPLIALALLGGCAADDDVTLQQFDDCGQMERYMFQMARHELAWDWSDTRGGNGFGLMSENELVATDSDASPEEPGGAGEFSTTNTQEHDVDEADIVETDGEFLYVLTGGRLVITRAWPIEDAEQLGSIGVDGWNAGMYLLDDGNTVVVVSSLWWGERPDPLSGETARWRDTDAAVVTIVDVTDRTAPRIVRETYASGALATSRRAGDTLYVVTTDDVEVPGAYGGGRDARAALYESTARDWQATRFDNRLAMRQGVLAWDSEVVPACGCEDTWYSDRFGGTSVSTVMSLNLADPMADVTSTAVVGRADRVYATSKAIYVVYSEEDTGPFPSLDSDLDTIVHRFPIRRESGVPDYGATGIVPGVLTDQFAISERDEVLRIATTDMEDLTSGMYTLEADGLTELDRVDGLAPGEMITTARFVGDLGYISTFEVTMGDPVFTFDLSNPRDIILGGELEVSGWSDYFHPIDEGHLLSVGIDQNQLSISLFDVTDLANPTLADRELLPAWSSEAQAEHHAFNWFAPTQTLTIPSWRESGSSVLEVLHADVAGIEPIGAVTQPASVLPDDGYWCGSVRRSVVMEDRVWAISNAGMTAASLSDPSREEEVLRFTGIDPCYDYSYGWF